MLRYYRFYANRHPANMRERRACRERTKLKAGFIALHRRPRPQRTNHRAERNAMRRQLAAEALRYRAMLRPRKGGAPVWQLIDSPPTTARGRRAA